LSHDLFNRLYILISNSVIITWSYFTMDTISRTYNCDRFSHLLIFIVLIVRAYIFVNLYV
jgi:hypothetical protein